MGDTEPAATWLDSGARWIFKIYPPRRGGNRLIELVRPAWREGEEGGKGTRFSSCRSRHVRAGLNYDPFSARYPVVKTAADAFRRGNVGLGVSFVPLAYAHGSACMLRVSVSCVEGCARPYTGNVRSGPLNPNIVSPQGYRVRIRRGRADASLAPNLGLSYLWQRW